MERLRQSDLRLLISVLNELATEAPIAPDPLRLLALVGQLVPGDAFSFNEVGPRPELTTTVSDPPVALLLPGSDHEFARLAADHPLVVHYRQTGDGHAVKFSDLLTQPQLHQLELYQAIFRPLHLEHQMAVTLAMTPEQVVGITVNRTGPDFSERDRSMLDLLRPYLAQVQRQAILLDQVAQAYAAGDRSVLVLTMAGHIAYAARQALAWIASYFGSSGSTSALPEALTDWLRYSAGCDGDGRPRLAEPLIVVRGSRRLIVQVLPGTLGPTLLLHEEVPPEIPPALGLSRRETEVLIEVARGSTDAQAADTLYVSRRTVQKHLEHAYRKLGVTNRSEALQAIRSASRLATR